MEEARDIEQENQEAAPVGGSQDFRQLPALELADDRAWKQPIPLGPVDGPDGLRHGSLDSGIQ